MNCRSYQGRNARSRKRQIAPNPPGLSIEARKRALDHARRELETLRNGIRTVADEIKVVEAMPDTTDEQALVLNAHLTLLLAQEAWMAGILQRAESALAIASDTPGPPPSPGTPRAL